MGVEYVKRRTVPGGEAADRSTKWKKVIPADRNAKWKKAIPDLVFGWCVGQCRARTGTLSLPP